MVDYIRNEFSEEGIVAVRAGKKGQPEVFTQGGAQATGSIAFANNPTATDTITLNGSWVEFSASATNFATAGTQADPYILQIAVDLATTLTNLATALNGSADTNLSVATYDGSSGTSLAISYDTNGTAGNAYTLAASSDTPSGATLSGGQDTPSLSLTTDSHDFQLSQNVDQDFILADGAPFQQKVVACSAKSGSGNVVITPTNFTDGTTITLDTVNDYAVLQFIVDAWKVVGTSVATIA